MNTENIITKYNLSENDTEQLNSSGITLFKLKMQVGQIKKGTQFVKLIRSCKIDDGIFRIDDEERKELIDLFEKECKGKEIIKFVPASGAASRMFKRLESFMNSDVDLALDELKTNENYKYISQFFSNLSEFAFYDDLIGIIKENKSDIDSLLTQNKLKETLGYILTDKGLGYSFKPKALIKFHSYGNDNRTAFEEQIKESIEYIKDKTGNVNLHFTISPELRDDFENEKKQLIKKYGHSVELNITFSYQKKSTDTIALDKNDELFRDDSKILLRPGGHGALIENLNEINSDIIFIKNIDNVQREENLDLTVNNKKLLGGLLIEYQSRIHSYLNSLEETPSEEMISEIVAFIKHELGYDLSISGSKSSVELLKNFLNRPIRICGAVENVGHPGGGPFWVESKSGKVSKQIIEGDQVDKSDEGQKEIFQSSTHFNPVDLACGVRDYRGDKFDLTEYVDHSAVFVSTKSYKGRELKALELPGLWNGAMANWITVFVEVPKETFTPVKEVNELLREDHQ